MSIATPSTAPTSSTNAQFQAWGSSIGSTLVSLGWVRTSDTGQINWATVAAPGASNTVQGYEMFAMADSLQATAPVFLKIEYGSASGGAAYPSIWFTVGTGTDGAGNLTGQVSTRTQLTSGSTSTTSYMSRYSGASNRISFALWQGALNTAYAMFLCVERLKKADGTDDSTGAMIIAHCYSGQYFSQFLPFSGTVPTRCTSWNCVSNPAAASAALGGNVYAYPIRAWAPGETSPVLGVIAYFNGDLTAANPITIQTWEGGSRTYLPMGSNYASSVGYGGGTSVCYAMRYD